MARDERERHYKQSKSTKIRKDNTNFFALYADVRGISVGIRISQICYKKEKKGEIKINFMKDFICSHCCCRHYDDRGASRGDK